MANKKGGSLGSFINNNVGSFVSSEAIIEKQKINMEPEIIEEQPNVQKTNNKETSAVSKGSILDEIQIEKASESKYVTFYLKKDTINRLKKEAKSKNISSSKLLNLILDKVLDI